MTRQELTSFEILIMELVSDCKTADDFRNVSEQLHDSIEAAIQEMCLDAGIDDYEPPY